jgi:hypothetical protein
VPVVDPAALVGLLILIGAAGALASLARRVEHQVRTTSLAVTRLRLVRQAVATLRSEAATTHHRLDHTSDTVRHQHRR